MGWRWRWRWESGEVCTKFYPYLRSYWKLKAAGRRETVFLMGMVSLQVGIGHPQVCRLQKSDLIGLKKRTQCWVGRKRSGSRRNLEREVNVSKMHCMKFLDN